MDLTSRSMKDGLNTVKQQQMATLSFSLRYASQEIYLNNTDISSQWEICISFTKTHRENKASLGKNII